MNFDPFDSTSRGPKNSAPTENPNVCHPILPFFVWMALFEDGDVHLASRFDDVCFGGMDPFPFGGVYERQ